MKTIIHGRTDNKMHNNKDNKIHNNKYIKIHNIKDIEIQTDKGNEITQSESPQTRLSLGKSRHPSHPHTHARKYHAILLSDAYLPPRALSGS